MPVTARSVAVVALVIALGVFCAAEQQLVDYDGSFAAEQCDVHRQCAAGEYCAKPGTCAPCGGCTQDKAISPARSPTCPKKCNGSITTTTTPELTTLTPKPTTSTSPAQITATAPATTTSLVCKRHKNCPVKKQFCMTDGFCTACEDCTSSTSMNGKCPKRCEKAPSTSGPTSAAPPNPEKTCIRHKNCDGTDYCSGGNLCVPCGPSGGSCDPSDSANGRCPKKCFTTTTTTTTTTTKRSTTPTTTTTTLKCRGYFAVPELVSVDGEGYRFSTIFSAVIRQKLTPITDFTREEATQQCLCDCVSVAECAGVFFVRGPSNYQCKLLSDVGKPVKTALNGESYTRIN